jgi:LysR family transcriptional regulator, transcriptional activator for bauABCD operon
MAKPIRKETNRREVQFARNLDWNLLKFFHEIANAQSVTLAAEHLGRKQPALSLALRRLEERLDVVLCHRGPSGFVLTEEGRIIAEAARSFVQTIQHLPEKLADPTAAGIRGPLRVTLVSNLVAPALDQAIAAFHVKYPAVELIVEIAAWTDILAALLQHRTDVGMTPSHVQRAELRYDHLFTEIHRPYCGQSHPLFGTSLTEPGALVDWPFILTGADEGDELTRFRLKHGLGRRVAGISDHLEEVKRLAILGVGLGFLPESYAAPDVEAGRLWPVLDGDDVPQTEMYVVTDPSAPGLAARDLFIAEIRNKQSNRDQH